MTSMTTRSSNSQNLQDGPVIKKRAARLPLQSAFNGNTNVQGLQRQNATVNLRKPMLGQSSNIINQQKELTNDFKKLTTNVVEAKKPATNKEKLKQLDSPAPMQVISPESQKENVFDLAFKPDILDIDENDAENPQLCSEYVNDIYQYMLYLESIYPIKRDYLKETGLKPRMRCILVDWLIQVHHRFQLMQETLYLTIALLDRYLQDYQVPRTKLQLVGVTAMLIASKYEEMYAPEVSDFVYITDKAFSSSQILAMERGMLKELNFNLGKPLPLHFLRRNSKAGQVDALQHALAKYLMELSLIDYDMCHVPPSKLAAAALCLSIKLLEDEGWSPTLEHYSTYSEDVLAPVVYHLAKNLKAADSNTYQRAVKTKYSSHKNMKVSQIKSVKSPEVSRFAEMAVSAAL